MNDTTARMIDRWFPVSAVDKACGTPAGSGRVEKAIFTWFASRPIAQARAAALTSLLPDDASLKPLIEMAILRGDRDTVDKLAQRVLSAYGGKAPVVLDMFSGRAIIPLEAARAGANAIGIDLSPVATLAGRLLAEYPARDWSAEPVLPAAWFDAVKLLNLKPKHSDRLARDVEGNYIFDSPLQKAHICVVNRGLGDEQEHRFYLPTFRDVPGSGNRPDLSGRVALAGRAALPGLRNRRSDHAAQGRLLPLPAVPRGFHGSHGHRL